jgi:hypothetical protein
VVAKLGAARVLLWLRAQAKATLAIRVEGRRRMLEPLFMWGLGMRVTPNHEEIVCVGGGFHRVESGSNRRRKAADKRALGGSERERGAKLSVTQRGEGRRIGPRLAGPAC